MHRIDGAGHVDHLFVAEDPVTLRPPTEITPEIMNAFQEELATFIEWAGIILDKANNTQLKQALVAKFAGLDVAATKAGVQGQTYTAFTTAGATGAFTLAPVPAIAAYAAGQRFRVKFHVAGNGSDKLNVDGLGDRSLKQYDSTGAKVAAVIAANQLADVEYDGADMVILDPLPASKAPLATAAKRLDVRTSFVNTNYQYQIQADEIVVKDAAGNGVLLTNVFANGDITVAGANGLDTGAEAANTWYAIWLIYNSTTQTYASLLSTSGTNPTMPAGYTYKALVSYVRNNASSNFLLFHQRGDLYQFKSPIAVLTAGTATAVTAIDIGSVVPGDAKSVTLVLYKQTPASVGQATATVSAGPGGSTTAYLGVLAYSGGNVQNGYTNGELMLEWGEYQANIYYQNNAGGGSLTIIVNGFRLSGICSF